ncbi:MAG: type II toxin-antitoxin system RelE/ParE family toxin [Coriobacteriales bacterium]|nr:type II toxin-antitoxin system RelE/ParE family toxin [Coriobacteriales bacterium]
MATYEVAVKASVLKDLKRLAPRDRERCLAVIGELAGQPRPPGCEKLSAQEHYRVRVGGNRIVYEIRDAQLVVWVVKVGNRGDVYRRMR